MRKRTMVLCLLALGVVWLAASAQSETAVVNTDDSARLQPLDRVTAVDAGSPGSVEECAAETTFETAVDGATMDGAAKPPCKTCRGREWCGCTYNGKPRISCDPCCYQGPHDPLPVCFD